MTEEEILRIKEHIEIYARRELPAVKIIEIMWKAVAELEHLVDLEKENKELQEIINRIISWAEAVRPREYLHDIIIDAKKLINKDEGK